MGIFKLLFGGNDDNERDIYHQQPIADIDAQALTDEELQVGINEIELENDRFMDNNGIEPENLKERSSHDEYINHEVWEGFETESVYIGNELARQAQVYNDCETLAREQRRRKIFGLF